MVSPVITESQLQTTLRSVLLEILPAGVGVIAGQGNRIVEPTEPDFVVMTPILRQRLDTNFTLWADAAFTGSASGTTLTVSAVQIGSIANGAPLFGPTLTDGAFTIAYGGSGTGGIGTYTLSGSLSLGSGPLAAGQLVITQPTKITMQLDFHSANLADSSDMIASVSTLFRSELATTRLFQSATSGVWPLYADEAKQIPFINAEQQYETRWVLDACFQINQSVVWPQQFADALTVRLFEADALKS